MYLEHNNKHINKQFNNFHSNMSLVKRAPIISLLWSNKSAAKELAKRLSLDLNLKVLESNTPIKSNEGAVYANAIKSIEEARKNEFLNFFISIGNKYDDVEDMDCHFVNESLLLDENFNYEQLKKKLIHHFNKSNGRKPFKCRNYLDNKNLGIKAEDYTITLGEENGRKFLDHQEMNSALREQILDFYDKKGIVVLRKTGAKDGPELRKLFNFVTKMTQDKENFGSNLTRTQKYGNFVYDTGMKNEWNTTYHTELSQNLFHPHDFALSCIESPGYRVAETCFGDVSIATDNALNTKFGQKLKELGYYYQQYYDSEDKPFENHYCSWQNAFRTKDLDYLVKFLRDRNYTVEILENNAIFARHKLPGYYYYPKVDRNLYSFYPCFHSSYFDVIPPFDEMPDDKRPYDALWGDGSAMSTEEIHEAMDLYDNCSFPVYWEKGDIVCLDNHRWTHGRSAFKLKRGSKPREVGVFFGNLAEKIPPRADKWKI